MTINATSRPAVRRNRLRPAGLLTVCAGLALAACTTSNTAAQPLTSATASAVASPAADGAGSGTLRCTAADVVVSLGSTDAGSTHRSVSLIFTNRGTGSCQMTGYPGVAALDSAGTEVMQAQRTLHGYLGGQAAGAPRVLTLKPSGQASALVEGLAAAPDGRSCTGFVGLLVTIPDDTASTRLSWSTDTCSTLEVHPVVPGTDGRSG
jgi:hypothetical protein